MFTNNIWKIIFCIIQIVITLVLLYFYSEYTIYILLYAGFSLPTWLTYIEISHYNRILKKWLGLKG